MRKHVRSFVVGALLIATAVVVVAGEALTFGDAKKIWESSRLRKEYQAYAQDFAQFNNHFRLDEKDGCYALAKGPVELMLVITHDGKSQYAKIDQVLPNVDNAKTACFKKSYGGIQTKVPPYVPFVLQLGMG